MIKWRLVYKYIVLLSEVWKISCTRPCGGWAESVCLPVQQVVQRVVRLIRWPLLHRSFKRVNFVENHRASLPNQFIQSVAVTLCSPSTPQENALLQNLQHFAVHIEKSSLSIEKKEEPVRTFLAYSLCIGSACCWHGCPGAPPPHQHFWSTSSIAVLCPLFASRRQFLQDHSTKLSTSALYCSSFHFQPHPTTAE